MNYQSQQAVMLILPLHYLQGRLAHDFGLDETLHTEHISNNDLALLQGLLGEAVATASGHMQRRQRALEQEMEQKLSEYRQHIEQWHRAALEQLEIDFEERVASGFWSRIRETRANARSKRYSARPAGTTRI